MSRIVRSQEPPQPVFPLGHGSIQWSTLPEPVREHVLTLWMRLLTDHLAHERHEKHDGHVTVQTLGTGDQPNPERQR